MINKLIENDKTYIFLLIPFQISEFLCVISINATKMKNLVAAIFFFFFFFWLVSIQQNLKAQLQETIYNSINKIYFSLCTNYGLITDQPNTANLI